jgi:hypothetical protein
MRLRPIRAIREDEVDPRLLEHVDGYECDAAFVEKALDDVAGAATGETECQGLGAELGEHARHVDTLAARITPNVARSDRIVLDEPIDQDVLIDRRVHGDGSDGRSRNRRAGSGHAPGRARGVPRRLWGSRARGFSPLRDRSVVIPESGTPYRESSDPR